MNPRDLNLFETGPTIRHIGFGIILFLYLFTWIVPVFKSLPLTPHESFYVYFWFVLGVFMVPQVFLSKEFLPCFLFLLLHLVYLAIGNYEDFHSRHKTLLAVFVMYGFPMSVFVYLVRIFPIGSVRFFAPLVLLCLTLTSITTIFALHQFPEASRALAGNDNQEEVLFFLKLNVGTYDFIYHVVLVAPLFIYFYSESKNIIWLVLFLLFGFVILYSQFAAALILFTVNILFTVFIVYGVSLKKYIFIIFSFSCAVVLLKGVLVDILNVVSFYVADFEGLHGKFKEVIMSLSGQDLEGTTLEAYNLRYEQSVEAFLKSPFIGGNSGGGHHYWLDVLALYGIIGFAVFYVLFRNFVRKLLLHPFLSSTEKMLLLNSTVIFIAIGLNKNIIFSMPLILFVICPLLLLRYGRNSTREFLKL